MARIRCLVERDLFYLRETCGPEIADRGIRARTIRFVLRLAGFLLLGISAYSQVQYRIDTVAGRPFQSGLPVTQRSFRQPFGLFIDPSNNLFIAESGRFLVDEVSNTTGIATVVAGVGAATGVVEAGFNTGSGDGGPATNATFSSAYNVTEDAQGNLYIADNGVNCAIRRVDARTGIISTYAGILGQCGYNGDNIPATSAQLGNSAFNGLAFDSFGNLYITDPANFRIRKVDAVTHMITTIAGTGTAGFSGNGMAVGSQVDFPVSPVFDSNGNLFFGDGVFIREIDPMGDIFFYAGTGNQTYNGDELQRSNTNIGLVSAITIDMFGNFYFIDARNLLVRQIDGEGTVFTVAGNGTSGYSGDGGPATSASFIAPFGMAVDGFGIIYVSDQVANVVRTINDGTIDTYVGVRGPENVPPLSGLLSRPSGLAVDTGGDLFIADGDNGRVREITTGLANIKTVAGQGFNSSGGDGGPALNAGLNFPSGIAFDAAGNYYIADPGNSRVRVVNGVSGTIQTFAGNGTAGFGGDGGSATSALLNQPDGVAFDPSKTILYIADAANNRIRAVAGGTIATIAGTGTRGFSGDAGPAVNAQLASPQAIAVDAAGNVFFGDLLNNRVREIRLADHTILTVAGNGAAGYSGDGGQATAAQINGPAGLAFDAAGNLLISDASNFVVRRVTPAGVISTIAGSGFPGFSGDGGPATSARLAVPFGLAVDSSGEVYIADSFNDVIRRLTPLACVFTLSPTSASFGSAGGSAGFSVTPSDPNCTWTAVSNAPWLTVTSVGPVTGPGVVTFQALGNSGAALFGTISVGAQTFTVNVAAAAASQLQLSLTVVSLTGSSNGTQTITVTTNDGSPVPFQATPSSQGGWLSITPQSGTTPATLTIISNPKGLAPGSYVGTIGFSVNGTLVQAVTVVLLVPSPLTVATGSVTGSGPMTLAQTGTSGVFSIDIPLVTNYGGSSFTATITGPAGITITPASGTLPALLHASVNTGSLAPGNYVATVTVTVPDLSPSTITIPIAFTVAARQPNQIAAAAGGLTLAVANSSPEANRQVLVNNLGNAALSFQASADQPWIVVSPTSGVTNSTGAVPLTVGISLNGFPPGTYNGNVTITSAQATVNLPVHAVVSGEDNTVEVSQSGFTFEAASHGPSPAPQSFQVLASGWGGLSFQVSVSTTSGGQWLSATPGAGSTDTSPNVQVSVDPAGLAAGTYYGLVQVASPGLPTRNLTIVANVAASGTRVAATAQPAGVEFASVAGATNPAPRTVTISNPNAAAIHFVSAAFYTGGVNWFSSFPISGQIAPGQTQTVTIQPTPTALSRTLAPGVYTGELAIAFDDGSVQTIALVMVLTAPGSSAGASGFQLAPRAAATCAPTQLLPVFTSIGQGFTVAAGWPQSIIVQILDDCGNPMKTGSVVASFSNGDPPLTLNSLNSGSWAGTWVLHTATPATTITASARLQTSATNSIAGTAVINGNGQANPQPPLVTPGGVVNAASFVLSSTLAPGGFVTIFGSALSDQSAPASALPLPQQLSDTSVLIAGQTVPLEYASNGQVNAVLPFGLPQNSSQQLIVVRGNTISAPETITISSAQPGIFSANGSGGGQGIVLGVQPDGSQVLADVNNPVTVGQAVVMYATGLGSVSPAVGDGAASPSSPLARLTDPLTMTIGGVSASVFYAGLAPGFASLYQVNATVPPGVAAGNAVPLVITVDGQSSPVVTIAVK